jgi:hypothetical protein
VALVLYAHGLGESVPRGRGSDVDSGLWSVCGPLRAVDVGCSMVLIPLASTLGQFLSFSQSHKVKDKTEKNVIVAFKKMLSEMKDVGKRLPSTILTDNGSEFINSGMKKIYEDNAIRHITTDQGKNSHAKNIQ